MDVVYAWASVPMAGYVLSMVQQSLGQLALTVASVSMCALWSDLLHKVKFKVPGINQWSFSIVSYLGLSNRLSNQDHSYILSAPREKRARLAASRGFDYK